LLSLLFGQIPVSLTTPELFMFIHIKPSEYLPPLAVTTLVPFNESTYTISPKDVIPLSSTVFLYNVIGKVLILAFAQAVSVLVPNANPG